MLILHKVQKGDTINSLAEQYRISTNRLVKDNELTPDSTLNIGQIIVIAYPKLTYIVQEGDTLYDIAQRNTVSVMELLRNNPSLSDREYLEVGEELVIRYDNKNRKLKVNGMTFSFIDQQVLKKTLPFLTYITVMGYQADSGGNINNIDDENVIQMSINYGVIPLMLVYTLDESSHATYDISHVIVGSQELQDRLINNIITVIKKKGYYGAIFGFQYVTESDLPKYTEFIEYASKRLHEAGYISGAVLLPLTFQYIEGKPYEQPYFKKIGQAIDGAILLSYQWATGYIPSADQTSYHFLKNYLEAAITQIPPEKIYLGVSRIAYEWELPYIEGQSEVSSLTIPAALQLANQYDSEIYFDDVSQMPYFYYKFDDKDHIVWFKDARYTNAILELVDNYGIGGISIWNIMYYFRIWMMINSQYDIEKLLPVI